MRVRIKTGAVPVHAEDGWQKTGELQYMSIEPLGSNALSLQGDLCQLTQRIVLPLMKRCSPTAGPKSGTFG